jgi:uncharacterized membrane protein YhhN
MAVKAFIIPLLIWLYLRFIKGQWNRFHGLIVVALVFSWLGDILLQLTQFRDTFFLLVLAGAILFVLSDSMIAINRFTQPFELARIAIMSSYITAQYLIAVGCARQYNLTLQ